MKQYRLVVGTHGRREGGKEGAVVIYKAGVEGQDILELTPAEVESFGDRVEPYVEGEPEPEKAEGGSPLPAAAKPARPVKHRGRR